MSKIYLAYGIVGPGPDFSISDERVDGSWRALVEQLKDPAIEKEFEDRYGICLEYYGSWYYPGWILAIKESLKSSDEPIRFLVDMYAYSSEWDERMNRMMIDYELLNDETPQWLAFSMSG